MTAVLDQRAPVPVHHPAAATTTGAGAGPRRLPTVTGRLLFLHASLDKLALAAENTAVKVQGSDLAELERAARRIEAIKLSLVARAANEGTHKGNGSTSTSAWLSGLTHDTGAKASRDVSPATKLEKDLPVTKEALGAGEVSAANAGIIATTMGKLPETLTAGERAKVEEALVRDAKHLNPGRLRNAATHALAAAEKSAAEVAEHEERTLAERERAAYKSSYLTMHDNGDGTTIGRFKVPTLVAHGLRKTIQAMTSPRRDHLRKAAEDKLADGQTPAGDAQDGSVGAELTGTESTSPGGRNDDWAGLGWPEKSGRAFVDLLEHLPTDRLSGKVNATILVTMTLDQVMGAAKAAQLRTTISDATGTNPTNRTSRTGRTSGANGTGTEPPPSVGAVRTDTGDLISTSHARRLACNAGIIPVVLGGTSLPLDLGRQRRFFDDNHRTALATSHDTCCADGCDRPYAWVELHHADFWARDHGTTNIDNAAPLCRTHHTHAHDPTYTTTITTDTHGHKHATFTLRE